MWFNKDDIVSITANLQWASEIILIFRPNEIMLLTLCEFCYVYTNMYPSKIPDLMNTNFFIIFISFFWFYAWPNYFIFRWEQSKTGTTNLGSSNKHYGWMCWSWNPCVSRTNPTEPPLQGKEPKVRFLWCEISLKLDSVGVLMSHVSRLILMITGFPIQSSRRNSNPMHLPQPRSHQEESRHRKRMESWGSADSWILPVALFGSQWKLPIVLISRLVTLNDVFADKYTENVFSRYRVFYLLTQ